MSAVEQVEGLARAAETFSRVNGERIALSIERNAGLFLTWLNFLRANRLTGHADELLDAAVAAVREVAALSSLGLARPATFALRAQIDLALSWTYFKDHPVEYGRVLRTGDGFKLKTELLKYCSDSFDGYGEKFGILEATASRKCKDPYRLLSAHVHAQSPFVVPSVGSLKDAVADVALVDDIGRLQLDVSEFISDHFFSMEQGGVGVIPADVVSQVKARSLTEKQRVVIFRSP